MTQIDAAKAFHIDDLAAPVLSGAQRGARAYAEAHPATLSADAVLDAARHATGLDDFGPEDFLPRLELQLRSVAEDPNGHALGALGLFGDFVRHASSRLRLQRLWRQRPEIMDVALPRPLIIAGLPRSGTTHLVNMIAADRRFRSLALWESQAPVPTDGEPASRDAGDARFARCQAAWETQREMLPLLENMHSMNPEHIHEEIELQCPDFSSYILEWVAHVPRWRDHYLSCDQTPHYAYMRRVLQALSWQRGPERWVLKSPQHLEQLPALHATFPDATVAITHRDPVSVIASAATMLTYGARMRCVRVDAKAIVDYWIDRIERLLRACVRDCDAIPDAQRMDIFFHAFMEDDLATVRNFFALAGVPLADVAERQISDYLTANPRGKRGQILYDLQGDFGVDPDALRRRFAFYFERFPELRVEATR